MTKAEKKQPALHMMIGDYFKDPLLGQASLISRAVWYELLMFMWEGDRRGEIVTTPVRLMGLVRCRDIEEILHFINEIIEIEFGYIEFENGVSFPVNMASCNEKVTLRNRRMYAEFKNRQNTRLRVERHRKKKVVTPKKEKCNADVTPSSSVSSSITTTKIKKNNKKKRIFITPYLGEFENVKITQVEFSKLEKQFIDVVEKIETLSVYLKSKGDKYKDHYATILNWERMAVKKKATGKAGLLQPTTYAQGQDAERRRRAKWLKEQQNGPQANPEAGHLVRTDTVR